MMLIAVNVVILGVMLWSYHSYRKAQIEYLKTLGEASLRVPKPARNTIKVQNDRGDWE